MATIGRGFAIAEIPPGIRLLGPLAWVAWLLLHLLYLVGYRNRASVLVNWLYTYLTSQRGARLVVSSDEKTANIARPTTTVQRRTA